MKWRETAPGLLYEARGASERLYVLSFDGKRWTIDLLQDTEYAREQQVDPQPAQTLDEAKRMAQELGSWAVVAKGAANQGEGNVTSAIPSDARPNLATECSNPDPSAQPMMPAAMIARLGATALGSMLPAYAAVATVAVVAIGASAKRTETLRSESHPAPSGMHDAW